MSFLRVNRKRICPICAHPDWCVISADGEVVVCMRTPSEQKTKRGTGWLHFLNHDGITAAVARKPALKPVSPSFPVVTVKPSAEHVHEVYSAFLANLVLLPKHLDLLRRRGLSDQAIELQQYRSMPTAAEASPVVQKLALNFNLAGIPGFYFENNRWQFQTYFSSTGYLVPIRSFDGRISAFTLRRDNNLKPKYLLVSSAGKRAGAGCGTPAHFTFSGEPAVRARTESLIITEGALKAQVIGELSREVTVGLVAVTTFDERLPELLKTAYPNLKKVQIAFDMEIFDPAKPETCAFVHVGRQRDRLAALLKHCFTTTIITWNRDYKGLDDYLLQLAVESAPKRRSFGNRASAADKSSMGRNVAA